MAVISRRDTIKTGAMLAAGAAAGFHDSRTVHASDRAGTNHNFGHTEAFGDQYFNRMTAIIESVRHTELTKIDSLTSRMADAIRRGGEVWLQAAEGHMGRFENDEKLPGNPGVIRSMKMHEWNAIEKKKCAALKKGDILVTNSVNTAIRDARDRGVHVVGIPVNYVDNEWTPRGFVQPNENGWLLADVSSEIIQSYVPYTQGIVDCPQVPEMKILPSSSNSLYTIFWMLQCGTAEKMKNRAPKYDRSREVIDMVLSRSGEAFHRQRDLIFDHAATVAKRIGGGAHYHVTTDPPGVQEESNRVASGPMMTNAFRRIVRFDGMVMGEDRMQRGDVHLFASMEPDPLRLVDEAKKARDMDMFVVTIAPPQSRELARLSDVFINNYCPEGAGLFDIRGFDRKIGTISSVVNNMLMWVFTAQFIDEMVRRGWIPWFYLGYYQVGGAEYVKAIRPFFEKQGF